MQDLHLEPLPCSAAGPTHLLVSQMMTLPSKPEVTSSLVLVSYSMFLTQLVWPCRVHTLVLSFLRSQSAMVVSSEQVANSRLSRNLGHEGNAAQGCRRAGCTALGVPASRDNRKQTKLPPAHCRACQRTLCCWDGNRQSLCSSKEHTEAQHRFGLGFFRGFVCS